MTPESWTIRTYTGRYVQPLLLRKDDVCLEDIAHHLAGEGRYANATCETYSVAQHSFNVMVEVSKRLGARWAWLSNGIASPFIRSELIPHINTLRWALFHDSPEYLLLDIPGPMKPLVHFKWKKGARSYWKSFRAVENDVMNVIARKYDICGSMPDLVKEVDEIMLEREKAVLGFTSRVIDGPKAPEPEPREVAERLFLSAAFHLGIRDD